MKYSDQVKFLPWVGDVYVRQPRKILFLGESHYDADESKHGDFTNEVIKRQFGEGLDNGRESKRCVLQRKLEQMFSEKLELSKEGSRKFWNEVAFYNFVQIGMAASEVRPTATQFTQSAAAFREVIYCLKPDVVVVAGLKTWDSLPNGDGLSWELLKENLAKSPKPRIKRTLELWRGSVERENQIYRFWCFFIPHPSARNFGAALDWVNWPKEAFKAMDLRPSFGD